jgi:predicted Zn-dependent protease
MPHSLFDSPRLRPSLAPDPAGQRFLSQDQCRALADRVFAMASGSGLTVLGVHSRWTGNLRWARTVVNTGGDVQETTLDVDRSIRGARGSATGNALDDAALRDMVTRAEDITQWIDQAPDQYPVPYPDPPQVVHPHTQPHIWFEDTYDAGADVRARVLEPVMDAVRAAGFLASGYLQVGAEGASVVRSQPNPLFRYYPYTTAQFSITVRDAAHAGSGWAGIDFNAWSRIDPIELGQIAIDKCAKSRNPVAVEPGRYTAILEPQAVCDFFSIVVGSLDRVTAEQGLGPFAGEDGFSKIGEKVLDTRLTIGADPMDPECGFVPFDGDGEPFTNVEWIANGVLKELSYSRGYAISRLQKDWALPNPRAWRMSGGTTSLDEMIASTERGVLVTRFSGLVTLDQTTLLMHGETRDGLWLIEHGKIAKAIKNFRITESPLFAFNNLEQLGVPQRTFHPSAPVVCPPAKVRDFSFTGLMDAV